MIIANPAPIAAAIMAEMEISEGMVVAAALGATLSATLEPAVAVHWSPQE